MKHLTRMLCLALCLCLLPILAMAETMTPHSADGFTYYVWQDWQLDASSSDEMYTYYYKDLSSPTDGMLMIMTQKLEGASSFSDTVKLQGLQIAVEAMNEQLGGGITTSEAMTVRGYQAMYFHGTLYGIINFGGLMIIGDNDTVVGVVVMDMSSTEAQVRTMALQVVNGY